MSKSLFDQLESLFSELIPLPEEVKTELEKELKPELDKMWQDRQEQSRQTKSQEMVSQDVTPPIQMKSVTQAQQPRVVEVIASNKPQASKGQHQGHKQRFQTAQELREAIVISEILSPPVALRKNKR